MNEFTQNMGGIYFCCWVFYFHLKSAIYPTGMMDEILETRAEPQLQMQQSLGGSSHSKSL